MEIACATCVLRPLVAADAASLALHANDPSFGATHDAGGGPG